ncbi:uncharacterized protein LOC144128744 isoform X1 [Amblyomma americanum]
MTAKIFIDLATQPFVADLVFPNGIPKDGYVTLFVGCCQRTPQPGQQVDLIALQQDSSPAIPVVRKTCHNQTYTEFCDGKIYLRNGPSVNGGISYPCNLRHSFESGVLTEKEHSRLHIQKEVPELCGDITPILKSEGSCNCFYCGFGGSSRDETLHHEIYHGGLVQSCILCQRHFKNESTLSQHLCNHVWNGFHCSVCNKTFLSKELHARHVQRNACSPAPKAEPLRPLEVPPPRPATVEPVVVPPPKPPGRAQVRARVRATSAVIPHDSLVSSPGGAGSPADVTDSPADPPDCSVEVAVSPANVPSPSAVVSVSSTGNPRRNYGRQTRISCPYCPRFCFSTATLQVHLRRKHIANAPLKCPHCPKRFFVDTLFYKHRSICTHKKKDVKAPIVPKKNRWTRLHCEHCDFCTQKYERLTDHYAQNHPEHTLNTCQTCQARFAHHAYMLVHRVQVHCLSEDDQPQKCSLCDLQLENMDSLRDHLLEVHAPAPIYRCFECLERFSTAASVLRHRDEKHNPNSVDCPECPKKFKNALACRRHIVYTHYSARLVHSCKFCYRRYKNLLTLRYHLALSHINELTEEERASLEPLKKHCKQCDYVTFNRRSMVGHLRRKHGGMLQCPHCPGQFAQVAELTRHKRLRHGSVGRQQCPHCPRSFVCPKSYEVHLKMHQEGQGHECTICQRLFESEAILRHHNDSHDARKSRNSRRCKTCLRVFATVHYLSKHQEKYRTETADGTVVMTCMSSKGPVRHRDRISFTLACDECHLRFKYQSSLSAHKMAVHGNSSKDGKSFTCDICQNSFVSVLGLSSHIRTHTGERPFACEECGASFSQASTLREHRVLKHSRAFREVCPLCSKGCVSKTKLRKHLQAAHKAVIMCAQPAAPRRPMTSASSTPARQVAQLAARDSEPSYVLPDLENPEEGYQAPEEECVVLHEGVLGEGMVPQVVAVATQAGSTNLAVAVDSIINLMVCDTLIETNCIELSSEEPHGGEEVVG